MINVDTAKHFIHIEYKHDLSWAVDKNGEPKHFIHIEYKPDVTVSSQQLLIMCINSQP